MSSSPSGAYLVEFVLAVVFGLLAYRESQRFRRQYGVTPWRWPSWLWGLFGFVSLLIAAVLLLIARRSTKRQVLAGGYGYAPGGAWGGPAGVGGGARYGAPPWGPSAGWGGAPGAGMPVPPPGTVSPPGWFPDPSGRHHYRFWDGTTWSGRVSDGGTESVDPVS